MTLHISMKGRLAALAGLALLGLCVLAGLAVDYLHARLCHAALHAFAA